MAEYIERETALRVTHIMRPEDEDLKSAISNIPTADVAPVVHGRWIDDGRGIIICPECKRGYNLHAKYTHYCPNCGAKMDGGADHAAD